MFCHIDHSTVECSVHGSLPIRKDWWSVCRLLRPRSHGILSVLVLWGQCRLNRWLGQAVVGVVVVIIITIMIVVVAAAVVVVVA